VRLHLRGQRVRKLDIIVVAGWFESERVGHVNRACGARLAFEAAEIGLNFSAVDFQFALMWKRDVLHTLIVGRAKHHDAPRFVAKVGKVG